MVPHAFTVVQSKYTSSGQEFVQEHKVENLSVSKICRGYHYMRDAPFSVVMVRITYDCKHHRLNIFVWNEREVHYLVKNSWEIQLGWQGTEFKLWAPALILPFGQTAEVFHGGTGIQKHKKDKNVPEEKAISSCCNACEVLSTTQVGSTGLMELLEVMVSGAWPLSRGFKVNFNTHRYVT